MENNQARNRSGRDGYGPRRGATERPLSASRSAILDLLRQQPEPLTLAALAGATGLHDNTVREHLDALVRRGLVRRERSEPSGRGRPAWLYELTSDDPESSEYAGLAAALAGMIARTSSTPGADATVAGEAWGRELAQDRGATSTSPGSARDHVVALLADLGFQPVPDPARPELFRLTRCPLLAAAHRHPEVVCGVHLGIVRGALEEYGVDPRGSELFPFSEPGACTLVVPARDGEPT